MNICPNIDDIVYMQLPNAVEDWNWQWISKSISMEHVRKNPYLPWDREGLSQNPTLTVDDIT